MLDIYGLARDLIFHISHKNNTVVKIFKAIKCIINPKFCEKHEKPKLKHFQICI